jgi:glucose/arabinose dehydrogenase
MTHSKNKKFRVNVLLSALMAAICGMLVFVLLLQPNVSAAAATLPSGFTETPFTSDLSAPTTFRFAPDGRLFVAEQGGALRIVQPDGTLLPDPAITLTVDSTQERGLLGIAFDPAFTTNNYIYLYYTVPGSPPHNRVSRFTMTGNTTSIGTELELLNLNPLSSATNHNGGALNFGADGKLYVAVGDNANSSNSQTLSNLLGKVLRINNDGSIPNDNPFYNTATGKNRAIWALGLRNPFNFAVQPGTGRIVVNDVGQSSWEEINDGIAGANYGWPETEGETTNPDFLSPLYAYENDVDTCSIVGAAFYNPTTAQFPAEYAGDYFFADLCGSWIRHYDFASDEATEFASETASQIVDIQIGSDGALYYLARGDGGVVNKITYTDPTGPTSTPTVPPPTSTPQSGDAETIINGGFETVSGVDPEQPASWEGKNLSNDKLKCNKPEKAIAHSGNCAFKFKGLTGENASLKQLAASFEVQSGETLMLSAYIWAKNVQATLNGVKVVIVYPTAPKEKLQLSVDQNGTGYELLTESVVSAETPDKIKVILKSRSETGRTLIDDLSMIAAAAPLPLP